MATHSIFTLTVPHVSQQCILINMFSVLCYDTQKKELLCFHREAFNTYTVNRNVCRSTIQRILHRMHCCIWATFFVLLVVIHVGQQTKGKQ